MRFYGRICFVFLGFLVSGCTKTLILLAPEDLYFLGNYYVEQENFRAATDQFERILNDYPASEFAVISQFKLAETYFFRGSYSKAAMEFGLFLEFNPGHKMAPQAQYYLAMSEFNRIINPERDMTAALQAKQSLERFLQSYKDHPDYEQVETYLSKVNDHLQMHEIEVGKTYFRMRYYDSAKRRLEPVLEKDISDAVKQEALFWLGRIHIRENNLDDGLQYLRKATDIESESKIYQQSKRILKRYQQSS